MVTAESYCSESESLIEKVELATEKEASNTSYAKVKSTTDSDPLVKDVKQPLWKRVWNEATDFLVECFVVKLPKECDEGVIAQLFDNAGFQTGFDYEAYEAEKKAKAEAEAKRIAEAKTRNVVLEQHFAVSCN